MRIRFLKKDDISQAAAIVRQNYSSKYERLATSELNAMFDKRNGPRPVYVVAEEKEQILGFGGYVQSWMDYGVYEIFWINVLPERQREGIGKAIVSRIIKDIKNKKGARLLILIADSKKKIPQYYTKNFRFKKLKSFGNSDLMALRLDERTS